MSDIPRKSLETFGIRIVTQATSVLTGVLMARELGPYGRGIFAYVTAVFYLLMTINAGQSAAVSWQYGQLKRPSGEVLAAMLRILGYGGIPLALIVAAIALGVRGQLPLMAVAFALPFAFLSQMAVAFYLADGRVRILNIQNLITSVGFLSALAPALLIFHLGVTAMLAIWACSYVGSALYATFMLRHYAGHRSKGTLAHLKEQVAFGVKASGNSLIALLNFRIDMFIILFMLGPKALGIYAIAIGAGEVMWQLTRPLGLSAFGWINSGSITESTNLTAKCVRHSMVMVTAGCLVLYIVGPSLITALYGKAFAGSGPVLRLLLPGIVAYSMTPFFSTFFSQQLGRPILPLLILSVSTVMCAAITFATVRHWGIAGGAIATSVSYVTAYIVSVLVFRRETGMRMKTLFGFRRDDIRPYSALLGSLWERVLGFTAGKRG